MDYQSLPDDVLERHLVAEPNNITLILEAARRFSRVTDEAEILAANDEALSDAKTEIDDLKSEIEGLKADLAQAEADCKDARDERDEVLNELHRFAKAFGGAKLTEPVDVVNQAIKVQTDLLAGMDHLVKEHSAELVEMADRATEIQKELQAEISRLNTVLELIADA